MVIGKLPQLEVVKIMKENCLNPLAFPILLKWKGSDVDLKHCS